MLGKTADYDDNSDTSVGRGQLQFSGDATALASGSRPVRVSVKYFNKLLSVRFHNSRFKCAIVQKITRQLVPWTRPEVGDNLYQA